MFQSRFFYLTSHLRKDCWKLLVLWLTMLYVLWLSNVLSIKSDQAVTEAVEYQHKALSGVQALVFQLHSESNLCFCLNSWAKRKKRNAFLNVFIYSFILFITKWSCRCVALLKSPWLSKKIITFILYICVTLYIYNTMFVICTLINIFKYFELFSFHLSFILRGSNYWNNKAKGRPSGSVGEVCAPWVFIRGSGPTCGPLLHVISPLSPVSCLLVTYPIQ